LSPTYILLEYFEVMVLSIHGLLLGGFALGAAAIDLGIGSGGRTIQNFVREVRGRFAVFTDIPS
jgi:hypothetical protein